MLKKLPGIFLVIFTILTINLARATNDFDEWGAIEGKWTTSGENNFGLEIKAHQPFTIRLIGQQDVWVYLNIADKPHTAYLYYIEPFDDIDPQHAQINWNLFDRNYPLAIINMENIRNGKINIKWFGVKNIKTGDIDRNDMVSYKDGDWVKQNTLSK